MYQLGFLVSSFVQRKTKRPWHQSVRLRSPTSVIQLTWLKGFVSDHRPTQRRVRWLGEQVRGVGGGVKGRVGASSTYTTSLGRPADSIERPKTEWHCFPRCVGFQCQALVWILCRGKPLLRICTFIICRVRPCFQNRCGNYDNHTSRFLPEDISHKSTVGMYKSFLHDSVYSWINRSKHRMSLLTFFKIQTRTRTGHWRRVYLLVCAFNFLRKILTWSIHWVTVLRSTFHLGNNRSAISVVYRHPGLHQQQKPHNGALCRVLHCGGRSSDYGELSQEFGFVSASFSVLANAGRISSLMRASSSSMSWSGEMIGFETSPVSSSLAEPSAIVLLSTSGMP